MENPMGTRRDERIWQALNTVAEAACRVPTHKLSRELNEAVERLLETEWGAEFRQKTGDGS